MPLTETEKILRLLAERGGMSELAFFAAEIREWKDSEQRKMQLAGSDYYDGLQDILRRQRTVIGEGGQLKTVHNLPNSRIVDNLYALMVDQKANYLVGKPFTVSCQNERYAKLLGQLFGRRFQRLLKYLCEEALKGGVSWLCPYYDGSGELAFRCFPGHQVLPFWADDSHTQLDCAVRLYTQEVWEGTQKKISERVELFKKDGLWRYKLEQGALVLDPDLPPHEDYLTIAEGGRTVTANWERIPLIAFRCNKQEMPLLGRVKAIQDAVNLMLSDFQNNMQEDARNTILVLQNYDGEDLGEFRQNLSQFGAVKVRDDGGVSTLSVEVNAGNYQAVLELLKKALIRGARGYDAKDDRLSGNPNQMNIQSMYSDIDLDANGMEVELQAAFEELLWFVRADFANRGLGDFDGEEVGIIFNRDILINETEAIENCQKSLGILSAETIVEQHPWVVDAKAELERLKKQQQEAEAADPYRQLFEQSRQRGSPEGDLNAE